MDAEFGSSVLKAEGQAILEAAGRLGGEFVAAVDLLHGCMGRVVVAGVGKSGIICRKIASTLAGTGTPALYLHPGEAAHGDLGMVVSGDVVVVVSHSGRTKEVVELAAALNDSTPLVAMTGKRRSPLAKKAAVVLDVGVSREACPLNLAPSASTAVALAMGDALAFAVMKRRGFTKSDFGRLHPGGPLGRRLKRVGQLMHTGEEVPVVRPTTLMGQAIVEMTKKGLGVTTVVEEDGRLVGIITDGDLRRQLSRPDLLNRPAAECMSGSPVSIRPGVLAADALELMEERKITVLPVTDDAGGLEGLLHLHDILQND